MTNFKDFKRAFQQRFTEMLKDQTTLYVTGVNPDKMWDTYLESFPEEERQEHNCNCCRQFIRNYGNVVAIKDNRAVSFWDFACPAPFDNVVWAMHRIVTKAPITNVFIIKHSGLGTDSNIQLLPPDKALDAGVLTVTWQHLFYRLPKEFVTSSVLSEEAIMGEKRTLKEVFKRSLDEIKVDAAETVIELIDQKSIYRGEEHRHSVQTFLDIKKKYDKLKEHEKDNFCWAGVSTAGVSVSRIRNTSIGTLLVDISEGRELDQAVAAFERIMAPANYKRPSAVVTKRMVEEAEKVISEMGYMDSLGRKFATPDDISVGNLLFVNRDAKKTGSIFEELKETTVNPKSLSRVEEVSVQDFVEKIIPKITSLEVLVENSHVPNFVSLIGPKVPEAPSIFKWENNFSWSYYNAMADSMKERVKAAGGKVDGVLRYTIQWNEDKTSICDLDAHAVQPDGVRINFSTYRGHQTSMSGSLDVDMINPMGVGIENIVWSDQRKMRVGTYTLSIHNYNGRPNSGFKAEVEVEGEIYSFEHTGKFLGTTVVAQVTLDAKGKFTVKPILPASSATHSKKVWGVDTNKFHKVSMIMKSPNHWEGKVGNEHLFFILEGAKNEEVVRGFFNEFLKEDLMKNKRVFEALGGRMAVEPSDKQLSGIGFSSTNKGSLICKVEGNFTRTIKVNF